MLTILLPDFISDAPYCLPYNSYDVGVKNFVLDWLIIT